MTEIKSERPVLSGEDVVILAIESSCDETAAAVVKNGERTVLSSVISSQIATHTVYGGVVPEIASREHIKAINYVIRRALAEADMRPFRPDCYRRNLRPGAGGSSFGGKWPRQKPWPTERESLWWGSITLRGMCQPILSSIPIWNRPSYA